MHAVVASAAYFARAVSYAFKILMKLTCGANVRKLFTAASYAFS
jgi:hypothetical protein